MSLFDIYKAKKLGAGAGSLFSAAAGKKLSPIESFNKWDEEWEVGAYGNTSGTPTSAAAIRSKNFCEILPNTTYYAYCGSANHQWWLNVFFYDSDKNFISHAGWTSNKTFTTPSNAAYFMLCTNQDTSYGTAYKNDICINISGDRNGEYQPHGKP